MICCDKKCKENFAGSGKKWLTPSPGDWIVDDNDKKFAKRQFSNDKLQHLF